jgi:hypothetical protein
MPDFLPLFLRSAKLAELQVGLRSAGHQRHGSAELVAGSPPTTAGPLEPVRLARRCCILKRSMTATALFRVAEKHALEGVVSKPLRRTIHV